MLTKNVVAGSLGGVASRYVRKVRTASGAVAVQVVTHEGRELVEVCHVGFGAYQR